MQLSCPIDFTVGEFAIVCLPRTYGSIQYLSNFITSCVRVSVYFNPKKKKKETENKTLILILRKKINKLLFKQMIFDIYAIYIAT